MPTLLETAAAHLQYEDWPFDVDSVRNVLVGNVNGDNANWCWMLIAIEDDADNIVRIYSTLPVNIIEPRRSAIAELITRINDQLGSGNFEINYMDGLVRLKTTLDLMDGILTQAMLIRLFVLNLSVTDQHLQTIMGVAYGGIEPALALEMREAEGEARQ